jgi:ABC-type sugar transport system ATPase subunit
VTPEPHGVHAAAVIHGERLAPALAVERLAKRFGPTRALQDVSFAVGRRRVHGLIGGNGSGKSTLIKILAGVHRADPGGVVRIGGVAIAADAMTPSTAMRNGLRFVHQDPGVFSELTVAENLAIGSASGFPAPHGRIAWRRLRAAAAEVLERFEVDARPSDRLGDLRPAQRTMVAIARALQDRHGGGSVLLLDEPTASLPDHEVETLLSAIRHYAAAGETIIYVSHRLEEVLAIVDDVTVLRDGRHVMTRAAQGLTTDDLVAAIVGRALDLRAPLDGGTSPGRVRVAVEGIAGGPLHDVSLAVRAGEIVGLAGLLGAGRSELLRMIFGALDRERGAMMLDGEPYDPSSPADAMRAGVAFVSEDRASDAAFLDLSVTANLSIVQLERYRRGIRLRRRAERADADRAIDDFGIRAPGCDAPLAALSGGNQQKVIVARWLRRAPKLLLLDEPTQGVDVGARAELYDLIAAARADGLAVLLASSDLDELAHVSDRVLVLRDGRIAAQADGSGITAHHITELLHTEGR